MNTIKVTCEVKNYDNPEKKDIRVHSHWNDERKIEIEINGERYTVVGNDLKKAIENCMNC